MSFQKNNVPSMIFTQFILFSLLFAVQSTLSGCSSAAKLNTPLPLTAVKSTSHTTYEQSGMKIIVEEVEYEDGKKMAFVSSLWILDLKFPVEMLTLDNFTPATAQNATFKPGDTLTFRSTDDFYSRTKLQEFLGKEENNTKCNNNEFKMSAKIYSFFNYLGPTFSNDLKNKEWFNYENVVCVSVRNGKY